MQREGQHPNWHDWRLVFLLGLPLGLLEIGFFCLGFFFVTATRPALLSPLNTLLLVWLMYFLSAGMIEYLFCWRRRHTGWDPIGAGFLAALVGCTSFMLSVAVWLIIAIAIYQHTPHPPPPAVDAPIVGPPTQDLSGAFLLLEQLALLSVFALGFSAGGARIGRALAMWRIKWLRAREQSAN